MLSLLFSDPLAFLLELLYLLPAVFLALSFHEFGHAFVAYKMGDPTARNLGRMTLDPIKHIDPVGILCLMFLGFGWAKPVPVNPNNFKQRRKGEFLVSIAGISMNFILAVVFTIVLALLAVFGVNNIIAIRIIQYIIQINFALMVFNLIPIYPLDGGNIIRAALWKKSYKYDQFMSKYGFILLIVLLFSGIIGTIIGTVSALIQNFIIRIVFMLFGVPL